MTERETNVQLTIQQIIGGHMVQFANEYHTHNAFMGNKILLSTVLKHKVESAIAMLEKAGYRLKPVIDTSKLKPLTDEEIRKIIKDSAWMDENLKTNLHKFGVASQATVDKIKAEIERQLEGG